MYFELFCCVDAEYVYIFSTIKRPYLHLMMHSECDSFKMVLKSCKRCITSVFQAFVYLRDNFKVNVFESVPICPHLSSGVQHKVLLHKWPLGGRPWTLTGRHCLKSPKMSLMSVPDLSESQCYI